MPGKPPFTPRHIPYGLRDIVVYAATLLLIAPFLLVILVYRSHGLAEACGITAFSVPLLVWIAHIFHNKGIVRRAVSLIIIIGLTGCLLLLWWVYYYP